MIEVWAPHAKSVQIDLGDLGREDMSACGEGWWRWDEKRTGETAARGEHPAYRDYAFVLDGVEPPLPDPRSAWQPHGVHGPSRAVNPGAFAWTDHEWRGTACGAGILGGVLYELHIGTFTQEGTFDAAIERLDHLVDLGVDAVEVMPVAAFPGRWGWGYDGVGLYAVHDGYGGPLAFQRFVNACHTRGLAVCLDVVHNHLGPSGNYLSRFGPYFTERHHTPWGPAINLDDEDSEHVRTFLIEQSLRWLRDFHVDALRLDAVHELQDDSGRHFLAELSDAVAALSDELGRPLDLIAESDLNDAIMVAPVSAGGRGMTAQWADDVHHALHVALTQEVQGYYADFAETGALAKALTSVFVHDGSWSSFRGRPWGAPVDRDRVAGHRFVAYLQTHDQVGNRAVGDRITASLTPGQQAIGAALYLLGPFTPMIFMGEEWAASSPWLFFTDFDDHDLAEQVRSGRRSEFAAHGWSAEQIPDPQDPATRGASVLRWQERHAPGHGDMLAWYRTLTGLRRAHTELREGSLLSVRVDHDPDGGTLVMWRGPWAVVANLSPQPGSTALEQLCGGPVMVAAQFGEPLVGHSVAVVRLAQASSE